MKELIFDWDRSSLTALKLNIQKPKRKEELNKINERRIDFDCRYSVCIADEIVLKGYKQSTFRDFECFLKRNQMTRNFFKRICKCYKRHFIEYELAPEM